MGEAPPTPAPAAAVTKPDETDETIAAVTKPDETDETMEPLRFVRLSQLEEEDEVQLQSPEIAPEIARAPELAEDADEAHDAGRSEAQGADDVAVKEEVEGGAHEMQVDSMGDEPTEAASKVPATAPAPAPAPVARDHKLRLLQRASRAAAHEALALMCALAMSESSHGANGGAAGAGAAGIGGASAASAKRAPKTHDSTELQLIAACFQLLATALSTRRWVHRLLDGHPSSRWRVAATHGNRRLEAAFMCCRDAVRASFALARALEALRRQHTGVKQLLQQARAASSNANAAHVSAVHAATNAAATAHAVAAANAAAGGVVDRSPWEQSGGASGPAAAAIASVSAAVAASRIPVGGGGAFTEHACCAAAASLAAAQRRTMEAAGRASAGARLGDATNTLSKRLAAEVAEMRALVLAEFGEVSAEGLHALSVATGSLCEQTEHALLCLYTLRQHRLARPNAPESVLASLLLHERRQLGLIMRAKDLARELRLGALRLDSLQPLLLASTLPTSSRGQLSADAGPGEGGLLALAPAAMAAMDALRQIMVRADQTQAALHSELRLATADAKKDAAASRLNTPATSTRSAGDLAAAAVTAMHGAAGAGASAAASAGAAPGRPPKRPRGGGKDAAAAAAVAQATSATAAAATISSSTALPGVKAGVKAAPPAPLPSGSLFPRAAPPAPPPAAMAMASAGAVSSRAGPVLAPPRPSAASSVAGIAPPPVLPAGMLASLAGALAPPNTAPLTHPVAATLQLPNMAASLASAQARVASAPVVAAGNPNLLSAAQQLQAPFAQVKAAAAAAAVATAAAPAAAAAAANNGGATSAGSDPISAELAATASATSALAAAAAAHAAAHSAATTQLPQLPPPAE
jgi:hypothetical protein